LKRLVDGDFDGILLAGAGVERLAETTDVLTASLGAVESVRLDPEVFVPAPSQGALAVQCRVDAVAIREALARIDDAATRAAVSIERAALALAEGGCDTAFGAYARPGAGGMVLTVMLERDGRVLQATVRGAADAELAVRGMAALDASDVSDSSVAAHSDDSGGVGNVNDTGDRGGAR
jgi:hydroxymethylbilane synthase